MRSLCLLVLVGSLVWEECAFGRVINIEDSDGQNILGHLYLLDSSTGHSQRLKRRHVVSPQEDIQRLRLYLSSLDKVIDIDLKEGSVWDSTSDALHRHGEHAESILPAVGPNCHFSGSVRTGDGYASFSFCNGVNGIIHTNNESYTVQNVPDDTADDTNADFPTLVIIRDDDAQSQPPEDVEIVHTDTLEDDVEIVYTDEDGVSTTTALPGDQKDGDSRKPTSGRGKATVEMGIYINANCTSILNGMKINTTSQIVDWVINRWNIIRQVYRDTARVGTEIDIKIKRLEIWTKDPAYYENSEEDQNIRTHFRRFCRRSPEDGVDHKMMYTWETVRRIVGVSSTGGVCSPARNCAAVIPHKYGIQRELHELGHNLGLPHDNMNPGCTWPYGFMGWQNSTEFKDCYRPVLLASLARQSRGCLYSASNLTGQVSTYSGDKLVPADQSLSSILDKW